MGGQELGRFGGKRAAVVPWLEIPFLWTGGVVGVQAGTGEASAPAEWETWNYSSYCNS